MFGRVTRRNVWSLEAPSVHAACSSSIPSSRSTGSTSRITNGMEMKIVTRIIDGQREDDLDPARREERLEPSARSRRAGPPSVRR